MEELTFTCPVCGADVPRKARSCPECGACEKSGWSEDQYLDGLDLPDEEERSSAPPAGLPRMWWVAALVVLVAFVLMIVMGNW